jgi:hypothetical protein
VSDQPHRVLNVTDIAKKAIIAKIELANRPRAWAFHPTASGSWWRSRKGSSMFIDTATNKLR